MTAKELKKILLIEDNEDIQQIAKVALVDIGGFSIEISGSGKEGLAKVESFAPQLILLDMLMPDMSGTETLEKLKANPQYSSIPVIFMTAKAQAQDVDDYLRLGASGVIIKPFDPITLSESILEIWNKRA